MPRERKPFIAPGSILPQDDILNRIVERDRQAAGRRPPTSLADASESPAADTSAAAPSDPDGHITSNITAHTASSAERQEAAHKRISEGAKKVGKVAAQTARQHDPVAEARMKAQTLAKSRAIPITLRLPEGLNDWLDDYAHAHRKEGVKKQDLISQAVQLLVVALTAGNPIPQGGEDDP